MVAELADVGEEARPVAPQRARAAGPHEDHTLGAGDLFGCAHDQGVELLVVDALEERQKFIGSVGNG
ncbi:hypothetical protein D3C71_2249540 [compost metagenome]